MTAKLLKTTKIMKIANILKKSIEMKISGYEKSILRGPEDSFTSLCRTMKSLEEMDLKAIQSLIDFLKSEYKIKCKHPQKMQDTDPNGNVYCMKCGEDV